MDSFPSAYCCTIKRYWRRRKYQRLNNGGASCCRKRLKITRLGGCARRHRQWKTRTTPKLRFHLVSPVKLLSKFHDAYIATMTRLACKVDNSKIGFFGSNKRVAKNREVISLSSTGEKVDGRLLMEVYKKMASSRDLVFF